MYLELSDQADVLWVTCPHSITGLQLAQTIEHDPESFCGVAADAGRKMTPMADPHDDRLTLEQQLVIAADARYGGFFRRRRFLRAFHPHRVLALLHRVEDYDRTLTAMERGWRRHVEELEARIARAEALVPKWRAMTPGVDNGWADELEEALAAPPMPPSAPPPSDATE